MRLPGQGETSADGIRGLTEQEAAERLAEHGLNRLAPARTVRFLSIFLEEITEPMIILLLAVAAAYFVFGESREAFAVFVIITGILMVEVWTEFRAKRAVDALYRLTEPDTTVVRDGELVQVPVENVVPGDVLVLRAGSRVPADANLIEAAELAVDESTLTGESVPAEKCAGARIEGQSLIGQPCRVFRGTMVTRGEGLAEVTATGLNTQVGRMAGIAERIRPPRTPLQRLMKELSKAFAYAAIAFSIVVPVVFILIGKMTWQEAILNGLSLAFATIPEELPILVTVVLGIGSLKLAREHALVRDLRGAETLGHVSAVVTDKTGTLTENRLRVVRWAQVGAAPSADMQVSGSPVLLAAVRSLGVAPGRTMTLTDPMDRAIWSLLSPASSASLDWPAETTRIPFSRERGWSGAEWPAGEMTRVVYMKGAPESVLAGATSVQLAGGECRVLDPATRSEVDSAVTSLASEGYRVLAVGKCEIHDGEVPREWTLIGLIALEDPLRPEAEEAIDTVHRAGVKVYMATGDHPEAARTIARRAGLPCERVLTGADLERMSDAEIAEQLGETYVFARITPAHKLRLVQVLQANGHVVAMTGDGSNDAPALKAADVGVAMGRDGTDAAREAAGVVLTDDRFATLVTGIREGRGLFANLQKAVRYYLAVKVGLISAMLLPALAGVAPPFSPATIILLELFMDLAASTAFVIEPVEGPLMARPPRPSSQPFIDLDMRRGIIGGGLLLAATVTVSGWLANVIEPSTSASVYRTGAFIAWMLGHTALAHRFRTWRASLSEVGIASNPVLNIWSASAVATAIAATHLPVVQSALGTVDVSVTVWAAIAAVVLLVIGVGGSFLVKR